MEDKQSLFSEKRYVGSCRWVSRVAMFDQCSSSILFQSSIADIFICLYLTILKSLSIFEMLQVLLQHKEKILKMNNVHLVKFIQFNYSAKGVSSQ